jgi:hypothetical protein
VVAAAMADCRSAPETDQISAVFPDVVTRNLPSGLKVAVRTTP